MAVVRARIEGATLVLASATPSIETRVNAPAAAMRICASRRAPAREQCRGSSHRHARRGAAKKPLDRAAPRSRGGETIARGEQALLFLNRRGYAPLTLCRHCGHRFAAPTATPGWSSIASARADLPSLRPYGAAPHVCPECEAEDALAACGPGVERLAEEAATCSRRRVLVLSSDFPGGAERLRRELDEIARAPSISSSARSSSPRVIIFLSDAGRRRRR